MAGMERVTLIISLVSCILWHSAIANLTVTPSDTEAKVNDSTYFNCSTDILSKEIHWSHGTNYVYAGGLFYEPYLGRFRIEIINSTGAYNLIIPSVEPRDVGEYSCQDDGGHGKQIASAKLIVLADEPTCYSNSIQDGNSCGIDPDEVQLSCSIAYHGNIPPQLEWRKAGENSSIRNVTKVESGNSTTYLMTLKTDLSMNNQFYFCQATRSVTSQYKCNSETIRLQYVFGGNAKVNKTIDEEVYCSANSTQSCSYRWFNGSYSVTVSNDQTLKPTKAGLYRCEATCSILNTSCTVNVMVVEVSPTVSPEATTGQYLWFLLLLLLILILITTIIVMLYRRRKRAIKRSSTPQVETNKTNESMTPLITISGGPKGLSFLEGKPERVSTIKREEKKEKFITGVTVLKDMLFVATGISPTIEVYDVIKTFQLMRRLPITELGILFDIACCQQNNYVFISGSEVESETKVVLRSDPGLIIGKKWSTDDDFGNLSVSSESNIILCVSYKNILIEYTKDGEKIRVINLQDLVHPLHAIKLTSGEFLVSHGRKTDTLHRVCNVSKDGTVVKSFGGEKGSSLQHLNEPNYLIVDEEGSILVVDSSNNRLLLLDSDLEVKREFLTKYTGVLNPGKLCLCKATRNLFLVDSKYQVLIFSVK